jgi:hypothetical protein
MKKFFDVFVLTVVLFGLVSVVSAKQRQEVRGITFYDFLAEGPFVQQEMVGKTADFLRGVVLCRYDPMPGDMPWLKGKVMAIVAGLPLPQGRDIRDDELITVIIETRDEAQGVGVGALINVRGTLLVQTQERKEGRVKVPYILTEIVTVQGIYEGAFGPNCENLVFSLALKARDHKWRWPLIGAFIAGAPLMIDMIVNRNGEPVSPSIPRPAR